MNASLVSPLDVSHTDSAVGDRLIVRPATADDFERYLPVVLGLVTQGSYSSLRVDTVRARGAIGRWLVDHHRFIRVAEFDDRPAGVLVGYVGEQWFSTDLTGHDTFLFVAPEYRGLGIGKALANAFIDWCRSMGAALVFLSSSTGMTPEATRAIYEGAGLRRVGPIYMKELKDV